jgi:phage shock protein A
MDVAGAKAYILEYITTLRLREKHGEALDQELEQWNSRITLARSKGAVDLALAAEKEAARLKTRKDALAAEIAELKTQIETMRKQLPGLAARERRIDPDLLEQELLMAAGYLPGAEQEAATDRALKAMEKAASADTALAALKAKMAQNNQGSPS